MITCTRKLHWCMGHRLLNHEGKCAMLHGHNYRVELTATWAGKASLAGSSGLDSVGRVVDFSVLKSVYDSWIQENWDHGFVLNREDCWAISRIAGGVPDLAGRVQKLFLMERNPTAENIADFLLREPVFVQALAQHDVRVCKVVVHETDNCFATVEQH